MSDSSYTGFLGPFALPTTWPLLYIYFPLFFTLFYYSFRSQGFPPTHQKSLPIFRKSHKNLWLYVTVLQPISPVSHLPIGFLSLIHMII